MRLVLGFEFEANNYVGSQQDSIKPLGPPGNRIFHEQRPLRCAWSKLDQFGARRLQYGNLFFPCLRLPLLQFVVLVGMEKRAQNFFGRIGEKIVKNCSVECSHVSLLQAQEPCHLDSQRFCKSDKLEVENATNTRFNLRDASPVN